MKDRIRVLHLGLTDNKGGTESVLLSWAKNIPDDFQFDIINAMEKPLAWEEEFETKGCRIIPITKRGKSYLKYIKDLKNVIVTGDYDFVHFHAMSFAWPEAILLACKYSGGQAIIHSHNILNKYYPFKYRVMDKVGRVLLANKKYLRLACGTDAGRNMFKGKPFTVIENGIDIEKFRFSEEKRKAIRGKYGIKDDEFLIGHIGRSGAQKNYPFLIKAFADVNSTNPNTKLMLIGNVDNDENVLALVEQYKVRDSVIFTGRVSDTSSYYSAMDVFFLPSLHEGLPVVLIEAQANGLPCVISDKVTREADVGGNVTFVEIDNAGENCSEIKNITRAIRSESNIKKEYYTENSCNKIFEYYRSKRTCQKSRRS